MPDTPSPQQAITPFIELQSVDSTNNYAFSRIHAGLAQDGDLIFTHEQWAGKGQRGKAWTTEKGGNILMSLIIKPAPLPISAQPGFNFAVSCGVHGFFSRYAGTDTRIKWPNDLYWQDRKAGGVLIESVVGSRKSVVREEVTGNREQVRGKREEVTGNSEMVWEWAVVGIGININQTVFDPALPNPVSLKQITGRTFDAKALALELADDVKGSIERLSAGQSDAIHAQYLNCLYKRNEKVKLKKGPRVFEALIRSVSADGRLVATTAIDEYFENGSVEWLR